MKKRTIAVVAFGGMLVIGGISNAVSGGGEAKQPVADAAPSSVPTASPSPAPTPTPTPEPKAVDDGNHGQTPAEVHAGFCQSVGGKVPDSGLPGAMSDLQAASADVAEYGYGVDAALEAMQKVADKASLASYLINGVDRLPALDAKTESAAETLQNALESLGNAPAKYVSQVDAFNVHISKVTKAVNTITKACS